VLESFNRLLKQVLELIKPLSTISYLYLASNSPRRRELFHLFGWDFNVLSIPIDEQPLANENPADYVLRLAENKVLAAANRASSDSVLVGADTVVVDGKMLMGKPENKTHAIQMLQQLRGRQHQVLTGIVLRRNCDQVMIKTLSISDVFMRDYTDQEIMVYVNSGDPLDKAGAYAIQHIGFHPVKTISGCYASVMGLPLCHLVHAFQRIGLNPKSDVPGMCQKSLNHICSIYSEILGETSTEY
jgi:septum formation protein